MVFLYIKVEFKTNELDNNDEKETTEELESILVKQRTKITDLKNLVTKMQEELNWGNVHLSHHHHEFRKELKSSYRIFLACLPYKEFVSPFLYYDDQNPTILSVRSRIEDQTYFDVHFDEINTLLEPSNIDPILNKLYNKYLSFYIK